ncbi:hypothetical protein ACOSQ2_017427 [Xanthoceras sorbifolium]
MLTVSSFCKSSYRIHVSLSRNESGLGPYRKELEVFGHSNFVFFVESGVLWDGVGSRVKRTFIERENLAQTTFDGQGSRSEMEVFGRLKTSSSSPLEDLSGGLSFFFQKCGWALVTSVIQSYSSFRKFEAI